MSLTRTGLQIATVFPEPLMEGEPDPEPTEPAPSSDPGTMEMSA